MLLSALFLAETVQYVRILYVCSFVASIYANCVQISTE